MEVCISLSTIRQSLRILFICLAIITFNLPVYADASTNQINANLLNRMSTKTLAVQKNQVLFSNGQPYIPYGISIYGGFEQTNYDINFANISAQITAAAKYWHANTIRLQVAESNLFTNITPGKTYNDIFLQALVNQVNLATSLKLVVVINDQTEFTSNNPYPTLETANFWKIMSQTFGNQPNIIFDLYNEPRNNNRLNHQFVHHTLHQTNTAYLKSRQSTAIKISKTQTWNLWKNGGNYKGNTYIGMQTLVDQIRNDGINNIIWVEGPDQARVLPNSNNLLNGSNIVYSYHHPNLNNPASWTQIASLASVVPVVDGEWAQYQSPWVECYSDAYTNVPVYLNFLHNHGIGLIAWSLQAGSLLKSSGRIKPTNLNNLQSPKLAVALKNPNNLLPNYECGDSYGQGAGQLLQNYFNKYSVQYY